MRILSSILMATIATAGAMAQTGSSLNVTPIGRILLDAAYYTPGGDGLVTGVAIPDTRLGVKVSYGNWRSKLDVSYSYGKIKLKDAYVQYGLPEASFLRMGYFTHHFGIQSQYSSSGVSAMEWITPDGFFGASNREIGVMYVRPATHYFLAASAIVDASSITHPANEQGKVSYGGIIRSAFRTGGDAGTAHIGLSGWLQSALHTADDNGNPGAGYFDFSANFPTRVCSTPMMDADVTDARHLLKLSPDLLLTRGRVAFESQYYYLNVTRRGLPSYTAHGCYAQLRGLLLGSEYNYDTTDALLTTPSAGSLELTLGYNYTDGNDSGCSIVAGRVNDWSATMSYFVNRYITARLRYSYTDITDSPVMADRRVSTLQGRLQFKF